LPASWTWSCKLARCLSFPYSEIRFEVEALTLASFHWTRVGAPTFDGGSKLATQTEQGRACLRHASHQSGPAALRIKEHTLTLFLARTFRITKIFDLDLRAVSALLSGGWIKHLVLCIVGSALRNSSWVGYRGENQRSRLLWWVIGRLLAR